MPKSRRFDRVAYQAAWHQKNKTRRNKERIHRRKALRSIHRDRIREYLLSHPCVDCGETDPDVLEFDHVRGVKREGISRMIQRGFSARALENEIAKCEVRCANCHRRVTIQRLRSSHLIHKQP